MNTNFLKHGSQFKMVSQIYNSPTFIMILNCLFFFLIINRAVAKVIRVPGDQLTIQEGINAAVNGDTVLVAPGTYQENINFSGKNIVVASHYLSTEDSSYLATTIIDGSNPSDSDRASCVTFDSGEDSTAVLQGFTITRGLGTNWTDPQFPAYNWRGGAGIFMFRSSATIKNNIIANNAVTKRNGVNGHQGGGILSYGGNPLIENNIIMSNQADYGAGVVIDYAGGRIKNNIIHKNRAGQSYGGGAFWSIGNGAAPIIIENNTMVENSSESGGGAISIYSGTVTGRNNILWGNTQKQGGPIAGNLNFTYSDIEGGFAGQGNIDIDPLFRDENFNLSENSPCIDAGDPNSPLDPDSTIADLGARIYYHPNTPFIRIIDFKLDDSQGDNDGKADASETVYLIVTLMNTSQATAGISVTISNDDSDIQIIQDTSNYGDLAKNQSRSNEPNPFSFSVSPDAITHYSNFELNITTNSGYTKIDKIKIKIIAAATILLVDDDGGDLYENYYTNPLEDLQIFPALWDISVQGCPPLAELQVYKSVIWFTGDDRTTTLTTEEQSNIAGYLDGGGKLLITGQDIGYDLVADGSTDDSTFYANYLHAEFIADSSKATMTSGINEDPITNGMFVFFTGPAGGAGNQTAPDAIASISPAQTILSYIPGYIGAALRYENEFTGARLVYLAFGFEGIAGPQANSASNLIEQILTWLEGTTSVEEELKDSSITKSYSLSQNFPNPFNSTTTIKYSIPQDGFVTLKIYNILGKEVKTLVNNKQASGNYEVLLDGSHLAAGIYLFKLQAGGFADVKKLIVLK